MPKMLRETWLRWSSVDLDAVPDQRAYLVRLTTRRALDRLRAKKRRKESYVGPWLPEPLLTAPDVAEDIRARREHVDGAHARPGDAVADERAVFVLREAFAIGYDEIADAVGKSPAAVRQLAHRTRRHVDARCPREVVCPSQAQLRPLPSRPHHHGG
jgi:DNA-directed RNA polymerase specialized sigma24 family protein